MTERRDFIVTLRNAGRQFLNSAIPVLESQRSQAKVDLYDPVADEVIGGLLARVFRFLQVYLLDFHLWAEDLSAVVLRMMLESVFYMRFLTQQNRPEVFLGFQKYGIGQEKLYKMQLRKLLEDGKLTDAPELRRFIDSDSDEEVADELVNVTLKNFEDIRKLATGAGSKDQYVVYYQPDSVIVHGHWPALHRYYLQRCREPLHRLHLQPTFRLPQLDPQMERAFDLFVQAYDLWITRYGLEDLVTPLIQEYIKRWNAALKDEEPQASNGERE